MSTIVTMESHLDKIKRLNDMRVEAAAELEKVRAAFTGYIAKRDAVVLLGKQLKVPARAVAESLPPKLILRVDDPALAPADESSTFSSSGQPLTAENSTGGDPDFAEVGENPPTAEAGPAAEAPPPATAEAPAAERQSPVSERRKRR